MVASTRRFAAGAVPPATLGSAVEKISKVEGENDFWIEGGIGVAVGVGVGRIGMMMMGVAVGLGVGVGMAVGTGEAVGAAVAMGGVTVGTGLGAGLGVATGAGEAVGTGDGVGEATGIGANLHEQLHPAPMDSVRTLNPKRAADRRLIRCTRVSPQPALGRRSLWSGGQDSPFRLMPGGAAF